MIHGQSLQMLIKQAVRAGLAKVPHDASAWKHGVPDLLSQNIGLSGFQSPYSRSGQMEAVPYKNKTKQEKKKLWSHCCALLRALIIYIFPLSRSSQPTEDSKEWRSVNTWRKLFLRNTETAVGLIVKQQLSLLTACVSWASAEKRYVILKV